MQSSALSPILLAAFLGLALSGGVAFSQTPAAPEMPSAEGGVPPKPVPRPIRKDRVFVKDVEGLWLTRDYVDALRVTRMPLAAARKAKPLAVHIRKDGRKYTVLRTDFARAVLLDVVEVEPSVKPGEFRIVAAPDASGPVNSRDVTYLPARGKPGAGRQEALEFADPSFSKKRFRAFARVDGGLGVLVNEIAIAGSYTDADGRPYTFTAAGEATMPDGSFAFELALAPVAGQCELIESAADTEATPRKRYGFDWKAGRLRLFAVTGDERSGLRCAKEPFAVLVPGGAGAERT